MNEDFSSIIPTNITAYFTPEMAHSYVNQIKNLNTDTEQFSADKMQISDDLNLELSQQSSIYSSLSRKEIEAAGILDSIKLTYDAVVAFVELKTREAYEDDEVFILPFKTSNLQLPKLAKTTESVIKSSVESYDIVVFIKKLLNQAQYVKSKFQAADRSWVQRSISLNKIVDLQITYSQLPNAVRAATAREAMAFERTNS